MAFVYYTIECFVEPIQEKHRISHSKLEVFYVNTLFSMFHIYINIFTSTYNVKII